MHRKRVRYALREENEVLSAVRLVAGHFAIRMCTRRPAVATGSAWSRSEVLNPLTAWHRQ